MAFVLSPEGESFSMLALSLVRYVVKAPISPQTVVANGSGRGGELVKLSLYALRLVYAVS